MGFVAVVDTVVSGVSVGVGVFSAVVVAVVVVVCCRFFSCCCCC